MDGSVNDGAVPHTLKAFDEDLEHLRAAVCELGGRAEEAIRQALEALLQGDRELAERVVEEERRIAARAAAAEGDALRLIALRGPLADDLREVLAALRISAELARIGACARNVARRTVLIESCPRIRQMKIIPEMGEAAARLVTGALDAFAGRDAAAAVRIGEADDAIDAGYDAAFRALVAHMTEHPENITAAIHLLFVAQNLERIGDHAVGIARIVDFAVTGRAPARGGAPAA